MKKILIIEDDPSVIEVVEYALQKAGFSCSSMTTGRKALASLQTEQPDLIILDLILPDMDGIDICKEIRKFSFVSIIMLTSKAEEADKIIGLELGADDYITKPFSPRELVARVRSHLRRSMQTAEDKEKAITYRGITLDKKRHKIIFKGSDIYFTLSEFNILAHMLKNPGIVFTRDMLINKAYSDNHFITDRTIDSHIKNIRQKLASVDPDADIIETIYGVGYKMKEQS